MKRFESKFSAFVAIAGAAVAIIANVLIIIRTIQSLKHD